MKFRELIENIEYEEVRCLEEGNIKNIKYDSRKVSAGDLFVAIKGAHSDGHNYIKEALEQGAQGVVGEKRINSLGIKPKRYLRVENSRKCMGFLSRRLYGAPTEKLDTIGVTGTNGKTTTVHLINRLLGRKKTELISTVSLEQQEGEKNPVTTPESPIIHERAKSTVDKGKKYLVMEVSSHSLALHRTAGISFDVAVFTNISRDHLNFHRTMEEYKKTKLKLFEGLDNSDTAILNRDDKFSETIASRTSAQIYTFGAESKADIKASCIKSSREGLKFILRAEGEEVELTSPLIGRFNVYNIMGAAALALKSGVPLESIAERISSASGPAGRMEKISDPEGGDIYIDFAHTPDALKKALDILSELYEDTVVVFGCGGESDKGKRPLMGEIAALHADRRVITNDNPKGEEPAKIIDEIREGIPKGTNYEVIPDRKEAVKKGLNHLTPDGALLIAGKGHEKYQIIGDRWIRQNDKGLVLKELDKIE